MNETNFLEKQNVSNPLEDLVNDKEINENPENETVVDSATVPENWQDIQDNNESKEITDSQESEEKLEDEIISDNENNEDDIIKEGVNTSFNPQDDIIHPLIFEQLGDLLSKREIDISVYDNLIEGEYGLYFENDEGNPVYFTEEVFNSEEFLTINVSELTGDKFKLKTFFENKEFVIFNPRKFTTHVIDLENEIIYILPMSIINMLSSDIQDLISKLNKKELSSSILSDDQWRSIANKIEEYLN